MEAERSYGLPKVTQLSSGRARNNAEAIPSPRLSYVYFYASKPVVEGNLSLSLFHIWFFVTVSGE